MKPVKQMDTALHPPAMRVENRNIHTSEYSTLLLLQISYSKLSNILVVHLLTYLVQILKVHSILPFIIGKNITTQIYLIVSFAVVLLLTNFPLNHLCSELFLGCLNLNTALPPENPIICKKSTNYCCSKDLCNSDEITREKMYNLLHASAVGKMHPCARVISIMTMQIEFVLCTLESFLHLHFISFVLRCQYSNKTASDIVI